MTANGDIYTDADGVVHYPNDQAKEPLSRKLAQPTMSELEDILSNPDSFELVEHELSKAFLRQGVRPALYPRLTDQALQAIQAYTDRAVEKHLNWWKADIVSGFIPKCSFCDRKTAKVVGQITKGEYAQEHNHRPVNWGYYCQRCYDEGMERENEAMYG